MFGKRDENWDDLDKDPDGSWIVGPVVYRKDRSLLGFVSCDTHIPRSKSVPGEGRTREVRVPENQSQFQRLCVDLVTNLLSVLVECEIRKEGVIHLK
jgi:hypothetical protein